MAPIACLVDAIIDKIPGLIVIAGIYVVSMIFAVMHSKKRAAEIAAEEF